MLAHTSFSFTCFSFPRGFVFGDFAEIILQLSRQQRRLSHTNAAFVTAALVNEAQTDDKSQQGQILNQKKSTASESGAYSFSAKNMFQHRSKSFMRKLGLTLAMLLLIACRVSALDEVKSSSADTTDTEYTSEDEEVLSPGEQLKPAGPQPYFEQNHRILEVKPENKTKINCPVKGFNDAGHTAIWYKNNLVIANNNHSLSNDFQVVGKFNLLIENFTKDTPGIYMCQIMPGNITQTTELKVAKNKATIEQGHLEIIVAFLFVLLVEGSA